MKLDIVYSPRIQSNTELTESQWHMCAWSNLYLCFIYFARISIIFSESHFVCKERITESGKQKWEQNKALQWSWPNIQISRGKRICISKGFYCRTENGFLWGFKGISVEYKLFGSKQKRRKRLISHVYIKMSSAVK